MQIKNTLLATIALSFAITSMFSVHADNKTDLLNKVNTVETSLTTLKSSNTTNLETVVEELSKKYDEVYSALGYSTSEVNYLVSLGKLSANYKADLINEFTELKSYISTKTTSEMDKLTSIKDNIKFNYTTITDNQATTLLSSINEIEDNSNGLKTSFTEKINSLKNEYTTNLANYKTTVKSAFDSNSSSISTLSSFSKKYEQLFSIHQTFEKNYDEFKKAYLAYGSNLNSFSEEKQKYYVDALKKELEKIKNINLEANKQLDAYKTDIDRLIELLLENF